MLNSNSINGKLKSYLQQIVLLLQFGGKIHAFYKKVIYGSSALLYYQTRATAPKK